MRNLADKNLFGGLRVNRLKMSNTYSSYLSLTLSLPTHKHNT